MIEKRNIQLIEFGGIPGAGKSTIFKQVNEYILDKIGYRPGPEWEGNWILKDLPIESSTNPTSIPKRLGFLLKIFKKEKKWIEKNLAMNGLWEESLGDFPGFVEFLLQSNHIPLENEEFIQDRKTVIQYQMKLLQYFCYVRNHTDRDVLMFSEGFYRHLKIFVIMAKDRTDFSLKHILELCPPISLYVYLDVKVPVAYQRMVNRPDGPPPQYRNYNQKQLLDLLERAYHSDMEYLSLLASNGVKILSIDNSRDEKVTLLEALDNIKKLIL